MSLNHMELISYKLSLRDRFILTIGAGIFTGFFVFLVFLILEGDDWYIITGGLVPNIILLFVFGALFGHIYYKSETKRFNECHLIFDKDNVSVWFNKSIIRVYPKRIYVKTRVDMQFYVLIGMRKITIQFVPLKGRRFQIECLLVKKGDVKATVSRIEQAMQQTTV